MEKMTYSIEDLREHYKEIIKLRNKLIYLVAKQEYTPDRKFLDELPADLPSSVSDFLTRQVRHTMMTMALKINMNTTYSVEKK